ncbi:MAG: hypothetical protein KDH93_17620 [Rhodoferax sp.]|nr:hypothetical protein [Rhodoferax sp.]MCP5263630.1 hypothetical protein [Rhodoferax sp.]
MNTARDDEMNRKCIVITLDLIESLVHTARYNMQPDGQASMVDSALQTIAFSANEAVQQCRWPDMQARALEAARRDKALQRALKRAHRKTPL